MKVRFMKFLTTTSPKEYTIAKYSTFNHEDSLWTYFNLKSMLNIQDKYLPIYLVTAFFGIIIIIGPCCVRKCETRGLIRASIIMGAFCMWLLWFIIYVSQLNHLIGPRLHNTTVAWLAHKYGFPEHVRPGTTTSVTTKSTTTETLNEETTIPDDLSDTFDNVYAMYPHEDDI